MSSIAQNATIPATASRSRSVTRHLPTVARVLLGLLFFVFGLDGFFHFVPVPRTPPPEGAMSFAGALIQTGYMFQLIKGTEVLVGALLLANRFVPLALALIAPVIVNIFAFSFFLAPSGILIPVIIVALELYLAWSYRDTYRSMLVARAAARS